MALLWPTPASTAARSALKVNLVFVGAHPDDDSTVMATLARYVLDVGARAAVITATRGEGGGNAVGPEAGLALGMLRESEERRALGMLGVDLIYYLDRLDFGFTTSASATEKAWGHDEPLERLVRYFRMLRPDVVITMNPSPQGHGHHQYAGKLATEAFFAAGRADAFPAQLHDEYLTTWQPRKLYYAAEPGVGDEAATSLRFASTDLSRVRGQSYADLKARALREYRSQGWGELGPAAPDPRRDESFVLATSCVPLTSSRDLLDGVGAGALLELQPQRYSFAIGTDETLHVRVTNLRPVAVDDWTLKMEVPAGWVIEPAGLTLPRLEPGGAHEQVFKVRVPRQTRATGPGQVGVHLTGRGMDATNYAPLLVTPPITVEVEPIEAVRIFRDWARRLRLERLVGLHPAEITAAAGQRADIPVTVNNHSTHDESVELAVGVRSVVGMQGSARRVNVAAGQRQRVDFVVAVPPSPELASLPLEARLRYNDGIAHEQKDSGLMQVVPCLRIPRQVAGMRGAAFDIPADRVWDGHTAGPADLSARFWISHDEHNLYLEVDVTDDTIVSNLAPDDIKAHWRTDAVELLLDPLGPGGSENTSTTFKVGMVAFDTTGQARAARDADALPGPIERTAPGMTVHSARTVQGYRLNAMVPLAVCLPGVSPGQPFGFNLLIYDADKKDAAIGENAGKARLGWSAWPEVQGTPRLWGRAVLEP
jgi:LmbE family N-acetylglucosaminyl deacetylase